MPPPAELEDVLNMHAFEVESVEEREGDYIFDIKILPNRGASAQSYFGMAEEILANAANFRVAPQPAERFISLQKLLAEEPQKKGSAAGKRVTVEVKSPDRCARYIAAVFTGIKQGKTPEWIVTALYAAGQKPISILVDLANFVMLETGQPLHVFDTEKLTGEKNAAKTIVVRRAAAGERFCSLDGIAYTLTTEDLVIADSTQALAIAGIKGGEYAGITTLTTDIILEAATFSGPHIRMTSQRLKLRTDASVRFEQSLDQSLAHFAVARFAELVYEYAGGTLQETVDYYPHPTEPHIIALDPAFMTAFIGADISTQQIKDIVIALGFSVTDGKMGAVVHVPSRRTDITTREDLAEEIGRIYGYENVPAVFPVSRSIAAENEPMFDLKNIVRDILCGVGFDEVLSYSMVSVARAGLFLLPLDGAREALPLLNPMSSERSHLRTTLLYSLADAAATTNKYFPAARIFELGKIFGGTDKKPVEAWLLGMIAYGEHSRQHSGAGIPAHLTHAAAFYDLKGSLDALFEALGIADIWYDDALLQGEQGKQYEALLPENSAEIKSGDRLIGIIGVMNTRTADADIPVHTAYAEVDMAAVLDLAETEQEYRELPKYPAIERDISLVINGEYSYADVMEAVNASDAAYVENTELVDYFTGEQLQDGEKGITLRIVFRAPDRTLSRADAEREEQKIRIALRKQVNAVLR